MGLRERRFERIRIDRIRIPEVRASSKLSDEQIAFFQATAEKYGILSPILVRPLADGSYELIGGKTRLEELARQGKDEAECIVIEASEQDSLMMHIAENLARGSSDPVSTAQVLNKAHELGMSDDEIADITGHTVEWVRFYRSLTSLPQVYQEALKRGDLSVTAVKEALRLEIPEEVDYCLSTALKLGWSGSIVRNYVERRLEELRLAHAREKVFGEPFQAPPPDAERLIKYERCMMCDRTIPREAVYMHIICAECRDLLRYVLDHCGPPAEAMETIYEALARFYDYRKYLELKEKFEPET